jgi:DNA polymerase III epsilon subunit-like protein
MRKLILDLETGGLPEDSTAITELCALVVDYSDDWTTYKFAGRCHSFVKPDYSLVYTPKALEVQNITLDELESRGRDIGDVIKGLRKMVVQCFGAEKKCSPIAQNAGFDKFFMDATYKRLGVEPATNHVWRCSMDLFRWLQDAGVHECYKANLDAICDTFGVRIAADVRHTAYGDVEATAACVSKMMAAMRGLNA